MASILSVPKVTFILQVKVFIDPKDHDTFLKPFKTAYNIMIEEPGCAYFLVGENVQVSGAFHWTEGWTNNIQWFIMMRSSMATWWFNSGNTDMGFQEQITNAYYESYFKATEPLYTSPSEAAPLDNSEQNYQEFKY